MNEAAYVFCQVDKADCIVENFLIWVGGWKEGKGFLKVRFEKIRWNFRYGSLDLCIGASGIGVEYFFRVEKGFLLRFVGRINLNIGFGGLILGVGGGV